MNGKLIGAERVRGFGEVVFPAKKGRKFRLEKRCGLRFGAETTDERERLELKTFNDYLRE